MGVARTPNKTQHTKLTPAKKILPLLLLGFELLTFRLQVQGSYQQAVLAKRRLYLSLLGCLACWSPSHGQDFNVNTVLGTLHDLASKVVTTTNVSMFTLLLVTDIFQGHEPQES